VGRLPDAVLGPLTWLADDPVRFGAALIALTAIRPLLAWPTTLLAVVAGFGYGWAGVPIGVAAMVATALPPYWLARAGRVRARDGSQIADRLCGAGERLADATGGVRAVTATRLLPVPSDAVSLAAGGSGIRLRSLLFGTALGELRGRSSASRSVSPSTDSRTAALPRSIRPCWSRWPVSERCCSPDRCIGHL